jgi:hypothetical protein
MREHKVDVKLLLLNIRPLHHSGAASVHVAIS